MSSIRYPLTRMMIRRNLPNHTFGMVRSQRAQAHQGRDLYAPRLTRCYAIADGIVLLNQTQGDYGRVVALEFKHHGRTLYAFYAHLSVVLAQLNERVRSGELIALTGRTGNAKGMSGDDLHLHFEIRTALYPGGNLAGRIDPAQILFFAIALMATHVAAQENTHAIAEQHAKSLIGKEVVGSAVYALQADGEPKFRIADAVVVPAFATDDTPEHPDTLQKTGTGLCTLDGKRDQYITVLVRQGRPKKAGQREEVKYAWGYDLTREKIVPISTKRVRCVRDVEP